jgi:hypothetical protein
MYRPTTDTRKYGCPNTDPPLNGFHPCYGVDETKRLNAALLCNAAMRMDTRARTLASINALRRERNVDDDSRAAL